jgi:hypothetical protein
VQLHAKQKKGNQNHEAGIKEHLLLLLSNAGWLAVSGWIEQQQNSLWEAACGVLCVLLTWEKFDTETMQVEHHDVTDQYQDQCCPTALSATVTDKQVAS